MQEDFSF
jgi:double-strand break repair protein MRE11